MPSADAGDEPVVLHIERLDGAAPGPGGSGASADVLGADPPRPRRRRLVAAAVVGVLVLAGLLADRTAREREVEALVSDVEEVTGAVALADTRAMLIQIYVRPVSSAGVTGGTLSADLDRIVRDAEATGADELAAQHRRLDGANVLPWHTEVVDARAVLDEFLAGEERRLRTREEGDHPDVQAVADAVRAAVPQGVQSDRLEAVLDEVPRVRD